MPKIKVCGMTSPKNISEISKLNPDFLGFIFFEGSKRFVGELKSTRWIRDLVDSPKKIGIFVDQDIAYVVDVCRSLGLVGVQLHGSESPKYCEDLRRKLPHVTIWKVFSVQPHFSISQLEPYYQKCDMVLFDSGSGGSGQAFDWDMLDKIGTNTTFGVAGGIGPDNVRELLQRFKSNPRFELIDINSQVEESPGIKSVKLVEEVIKEVRS